VGAQVREHLGEVFGQEVRQREAVVQRRAPVDQRGPEGLRRKPREERAEEEGDGNLKFGPPLHAQSAQLFSKLPYDPIKDFAPITEVISTPVGMMLTPSVPAKTVKEFIAYAKANPGKLNYGSAGNGTTHHLAVELFKTMTGTQLVHVPYKGAGPLMQDLLAGQVDLAFDGMGTSATQIKAGKLRPIAVTTLNRSRVIPDVPTLQEAGLSGYQVTTWYALWGIRGTPKEAIDRLYQETAKALALPDMREIWASQGADAGGQRPEEFAALVKSEIAKWAKVVKDAGVKIDL